jgi:hypothetical protein
MALLCIQHTVRDYADWLAGYDTLEEEQRNWGVTAASVHQLANEPNTVLVLQHFVTVAQAQGFLTNRALQDVLQRATIEGTLRVEIYDENEQVRAADEGPEGSHHTLMQYR